MDGVCETDLQVLLGLVLISITLRQHVYLLLATSTFCLWIFLDWLSMGRLWEGGRGSLGLKEWYIGWE